LLWLVYQRNLVPEMELESRQHK